MLFSLILDFNTTEHLKLQADRAIGRVTRVGMVLNIILSAIKLTVGYIIGSLALVADGWHSLSDLVSDVVVLAGAVLAGKPPDRNHPYGHGKIETFAAWLLAAILFFVGGVLIFQALKTISAGTVGARSIWIICAALLSIVTKEWLYHITMTVARRFHSHSVKANAWHHRSDAFSSVVVLFGGLSAYIGIPYGDAVAGALVGLMVIIVALRIGVDAVRELSEASAGGEIQALVEEIIAGHSEVRGWHRLRIRRLGRELAMDMHIMLEARMSVKEAHDIIFELENQLIERVDWPVSITIHIDPDTEEIRQASRRRKDSVVR